MSTPVEQLLIPEVATPHLPEGYTILALETSCDETAAALVRDGRTLVANVVASQLDTHRRYGGVVPEVASRQHILSLTPVLEETLARLPHGWADVHAVAATYGPGLSGALLTGLNAAKAIAWQRGVPFIGVNHLEGHIYANWINPDSDAALPAEPCFPLLALVISGGHTLLVLMRGHGEYQVLGQTRDDAVGEAFDKVARILGLGYPGGPAIQQAAAKVQTSTALPRSWLRDTYDFSFSGLKTAVLHKVQEVQKQQQRLDARPRRGRRSGEVGDVEPAPPAPEQLPEQYVAQMAHAFQESVVDVLVAKAVDAAHRYGAHEILLAGGVAANTRLRSELERRARVSVRYPPIWLCTDNAAMIAAAAYYRFDAGRQPDWSLDVRPNLPLR